MYSFKEETKFIENKLTEEGVTSESIYILQQGELAVLKKHKDQIINVAVIGEMSNEIIGEECLFTPNSLHSYTTIVISQEAKFLKIS